jgi:hypothetical protein
VKRLVMLVAALSLALPVMQFETGLLDRLNVALGNAGVPSASAPSSSSDLHIDVPSALRPLIHALDR